MQNNKIYIVGVDFSITSPSITILSYNTIGELLGVDSIMVAQNKKQCLNDAIRLKYDNIEWHFHLLEFEETKTLCPELRYQRISQKLFNKMIEMIGNGENVHIAIEDYSFGSNGRLTDIAECVSVFKQICYNHFKKPMKLLAPSTIKKHFTKKGNANKILMYRTLLEHTNNIDIREKINNIKHFELDNPKCGIPAPLSDVVDSLACAFTLKKCLTPHNHCVIIHFL
jgi:predicted DNA-binding protein YlxM (UPF0122 family)